MHGRLRLAEAASPAAAESASASASDTPERAAADNVSVCRRAAATGRAAERESIHALICFCSAPAEGGGLRAFGLQQLLVLASLLQLPAVLIRNKTLEEKATAAVGLPTVMAIGVYVQQQCGSSSCCCRAPAAAAAAVSLAATEAAQHAAADSSPPQPAVQQEAASASATQQPSTAPTDATDTAASRHSNETPPPHLQQQEVRQQQQQQEEQQQRQEVRQQQQALVSAVMHHGPPQRLPCMWLPREELNKQPQQALQLLPPRVLAFAFRLDAELRVSEVALQKASAAAAFCTRSTRADAPRLTTDRRRFALNCGETRVVPMRGQLDFYTAKEEQGAGEKHG
ncbi:hypothetical protein cyc_01106 [Cyclospora cayetanensis]|uniref:Uncharacterized protein n=1 Tax=Cyclospora cayetanensis TaxID=88456 RepID=A0A1D3CYJ4_9EIME|nr:hypothetical protein cyc_01106 [Cyclospora cayetanensis]